MKVNNDTGKPVPYISPNAQQMTFDADGIVHLMSILSNMYKNGPESVLREYACNALDSHIQAGTDEPVLVTLPTHQDPWLVIQDFGVGLSKEEIVNVYATYGKSTKRDNNDQVGAFGIGAKSAFTLTDRFSVTGIKDGQKTVAVFTMSPNLGATVGISWEGTTRESNGVTVKIDTNKYGEFLEAAPKVFSAWKEGSVLVDDVEPKSIFDGTQQINDHVYALPIAENGYGMQKLGVVMGGVYYAASDAMIAAARVKTPLPANRNFLDQLRYYGNSKFSIIAEVPIGSVDITPSREDLRDTPRTIDMLIQIANDFNSGLVKNINHEMSVALTAIDAIRRLKKFSLYANNIDEFEWNGSKYNVAFKSPWRTVIPGRGAKLADAYETGVEVDGAKIDLSQLLFVTDTPDDARLEDLRKISLRAINTYKYIFFVPDSVNSHEWLSYGDNTFVDTMSLSFYKKTFKRPPPARNSLGPRYWLPIQGTTYNSQHLYAKDIVALKKRVVVFDGQYRMGSHSFVLSDGDIGVELQGLQKFEPFKKRVPNAVFVSDLIQSRAKAIFDSITDEEYTALKFLRWRQEQFSTWHMALIRNYLPKIDFGVGRELLEGHLAYEKMSGTRQSEISLACRAIKHTIQPTKTFDANAFLDKYPLLRHIISNAPSAKEVEHVKTYVDAINRA